jgi:endonuclease YncB( thermonuclease family)
MRHIIIVFLLLLSVIGLSEEFTGKCVGVSDGDTITVLNGSAPVRIRLAGIDAPESHQDFGSKSKQFLSGMVFGKEVRVVVQGMDQYKRIVGDVHLGETWANFEVVKAGLAWHYKAYSKDSRLADAEAKARSAGIGLWSLPNPTPPWEFRRIGSGKQASPSPSSASSAPAAGSSTVVFVTPSGKKFHRKECRHAAKGVPVSRAEAEKDRTPCAVCRP